MQGEKTKRGDFFQVYNERPHSALVWKTPAESAQEYASQANFHAAQEAEIYPLMPLQLRVGNL